MVELNFSEIEKKWQNRWEKEKIFEVNENSAKPKYYLLEMFPYPSGSGLHMGHAWNYTIGDILARFKIMQGFNVLHPMGYDALGLPAENAAIKEGIHPEDYTLNSIKNYIRQQKNLGLSYDWSRMLNTADPDYYKWDQDIFLKMFEKGLAYQKISAVNWCPKCNTVLANEQAQSGKCERCETKVEVKHLKQWFFKITNYADELYEGISKLDWPERTKAMQKNWIGKSSGAEIDFEIDGKIWPIFTTRPDTIFGVTFMVVSAQHAKLMELVTKEQKKDVEKFLKRLNSVSEKELDLMEKEGVFTGSYAINPANGEKVPVYAGNFVVADYGSGMVMAVPAHDSRDFEFAKKYGIKIKEVIDSEEKIKDKAYTSSGNLINSKQFDNLSNEEAKEKITAWLIEKNKARKVVNYKLRDWCLSRQRYWGTPIPIIHCEKCGAVAVSEKDLPIKLPREVKFGKGNPLETNEDWIKVKCPKCNGKARRETDTMDTFVNSSWYFLRYCDSKNKNKIFDSKKANYWCPIDTYVGGAEHACMHLIYVRFYTKFLRDLGLINFGEPAKKLFHQGMLHAEGGEKMSKSKGNVVLPETVSDKYGIDTARFFLCSLASPDKDIDWSEAGISGSLKFINKVVEIYSKIKIGKDSREVLFQLNSAIQQITKSIEGICGYRDATIRLRELFDVLEKFGEASKETLKSAIKLLSPFCPHISEELWEKLGNNNFISLAEWPKVDKTKLNKKETKENLNDKISNYVSLYLNKVEEKQKVNKIYLYVMPFEISSIDVKKISKTLKKNVEIFATNDSKKYDPENKSKKAIPGMPGIYFE